MKKNIRSFAVLVLGMSLLLGIIQIVTAYHLMDREINFFKPEEEQQLIALTQSYSRKLMNMSSESSNRDSLTEESIFISKRSAFLTAFLQYRKRLVIFWLLKSALLVGSVTITFLFLIIHLSRSMEQKELVAQAQTARERWQTTGRIMIHELKNTLSPLDPDMEFLLLQNNNSEETPLSRCIARMRRNLERTASILRAFRSFSELPVPAFTSCFPSDILLEVNKAAGEVSLFTETELQKATDMKIFSDAKYLRVIFINLIKNAREAGVTEITIKRKKNAIILQDNGPGLPDKVLGYVQNGNPKPGITTKKEGTGMGIYIVFELCRMLGINISMYNTEKGLATAMEFRHV